MDDGAVTEDLIYGGRLRIRQPARGYRVNVDTVLLAASLPPQESADGCRIVELGCGAGAGLLIVAAGHREARPGTRVYGIEREPIFAALARENAAANGLADCVEIIEADALDPPDLGGFEHVFFNPPYDYAGEGRPPAPERRHAHVADRPLADWIKLWSNRMTAQASLTLIQRPQRLREILDALEGRLGGAVVFPIRPYAEAPATRLIVRARKGARAPLKLLPGLDLHPSGATAAKHTPQTEAVLRGQDHIRLG